MDSTPKYVAFAWVTRKMRETLRAEAESDGIHVSVICPGIIDTPMARDATAQAQGKKESEIDFEELSKQRAARVPMKRTGTGWDIAKAAVFLASDDASYITGTEIYVDGGLNCVA
mgnify:CR=1 FL=1